MQGLSATDTKALEILGRLGPMTAGDLGRHAGLAPASITGPLDRLQKRGFVRRVKDPDDGRRLVIELVPVKLEAFAPHFISFMRSMNALYASYTLTELETILHFLREAARRQSEATFELTTS